MKDACNPDRYSDLAGLGWNAGTVDFSVCSQSLELLVKMQQML